MDGLHEDLHALRVNVESNQLSKCCSEKCLEKKHTHTQKNEKYFMSDKYFSKSYLSG